MTNMSIWHSNVDCPLSFKIYSRHSIFSDGFITIVVMSGYVFSGRTIRSRLVKIWGQDSIVSGTSTKQWGYRITLLLLSIDRSHSATIFLWYYAKGGKLKFFYQMLLCCVPGCKSRERWKSDELLQLDHFKINRLKGMESKNWATFQETTTNLVTH